MTTFEDGPAKGQCLLLERAPVFLRVVHVRMVHWDALDKTDDRPRDDETIHVYRIASEVGMCHINRRGGGGGFYTCARYRYVESQPSDEQVRDTSKWREWCLRQVARPPAEQPVREEIVEDI